MRPYAFACLLALASFTLVAGACNFKLGDDTEGEMGNLRFSYSGPGCFFGCALDKRALQGGKVTVAVDGDTTGGLTAAIDEGSAVSVSTQTETCRCLQTVSGTTKTRLVQRGEGCESGESKKCSLSVEISALTEGFGKLKIVDGKGGVVDQVDVAVRPATRLELSVKSNGKDLTPKDGVFTLQMRADTKLSVKAFDSDGDELFWSRDGMKFTYDGPGVLYGDGIAFSVDNESISAIGEGDATAEVVAPGDTARATARFHVTP